MGVGPVVGEEVFMPELTDEELAELRGQAASAAALTEELASVREAAARELREAVVASHPELPAQLVVGSTAAELEASVASATSVVEAIRERTLEDVRGLAAGKPPIGFRPPARAGAAPVGPPEGARGLERVRWGLENEGGK